MGVVLPTQEAWDRVSKSTRDAESKRTRRGAGRQLQPGTHPGLHVKIVGAPIVVLTSTTTSGTGTTVTTSTTSGTTVTTCPTSSTTSGTTTTTTPAPKYLYPAVLVYPNFDSLDNEQHWLNGQECFAQEPNNGPLGLNCIYPAVMSGEYQGVGVFSCRGDGTNLPCSTTGQGTTTSQGCVGVCDWTRDVGTGNWVLTSSSCCPAGVCDCPQPDFCPPPGSCDAATTETYCFKGADQTVAIVNCPTSGTGTTTTGTGTTSTTGTGTTTNTPDPMRCGTGCACKYVPGVGNVVVSNDCTPGDLGGGCYCTGGCACSGNPDTPCTPVTASCITNCTPPPPPLYCDGYCVWISTGEAWLQSYAGCNSNGPPCVCDKPPTPGPCAATARTPCYTPKPPPPPPTTSGTGTTTSGTGTTSTTSTRTTTTRGGCLDSCILGWNVGASTWDIISSCGPSCDCAQPTFDGIDGCSIARVPCVSTSGTTSTTGTGTTTTSPCGTQPCAYYCDGSSWALSSPCSSEDCFCPEPGFACTPGFNGTYADGFCVGTSGTTSTTGTSTTTSAGPPCCGRTEPCVFKCAFVGFGIDPSTGQPIPIYDWVVCRNRCDASGLAASCCPPTAFPVGSGLGHCGSVNAGECKAGQCLNQCPQPPSPSHEGFPTGPSP